MADMIAVKDIMVGDDFNPRKGELKGIPELAISIKESGLIQPIVVREGGADAGGRRKYFLVAGHRRLAALKHLGRTQTKVVFVKGNSQDLAIMALVENAQRLDLDPYMEAEAMQTCMERFNLTQKQLAEKLGVSEPHISQRLGILKKSIPAVKAAVEGGKISPTHARELAGLPAEEQQQVLDKIEKKQADGKKVTVAEVKDDVDRRKQRIREEKDPAKEKERKERIKVAKTTYEGFAFAPRPKKDVLEQIGVLHNRAQRVQSETSQLQVKSQIAALEWWLGVRESL